MPSIIRPEGIGALKYGAGVRDLWLSQMKW